MSTFTEVSMLCREIATLKAHGAPSPMPSAGVVALMVVRNLVDRMQWSDDHWSLVETDAANKESGAFVSTVEFRVPTADVRVHAIIRVKSTDKQGMYSVECLKASSTFEMYDELALADLVADAARKVRKGLLEEMLGK